MLESSLFLGGGSSIKHCIGLNQAVIYASSKSKIVLDGGVEIYNNTAASASGATIGLYNTDLCSLTGVSFEKNYQDSIQMQLGEVNIFSSNFTDGKG